MALHVHNAEALQHKPSCFRSSGFCGCRRTYGCGDGLKGELGDAGTAAEGSAFNFVVKPSVYELRRQRPNALIPIYSCVRSHCHTSGLSGCAPGM
jgi:hypothetical protein